MRKGLIQVYTGDGKGKTTAAIGQAIRARGRGCKVLLVHFLKGERGSGEVNVLRKVGVKVLFWGNIYGKELLRKTPVENIEKIREEGRLFLQELIKKSREESYDFLILDEINTALYRKLIEEKTVLDILQHKPVSLEVILTGRGAPSSIISLAHLVTEMGKVKHPYDQGIKARKGVEY